VLYLAHISFVLCGAESVPAPPLEMQEIILAPRVTTISPAQEQEKVSFQPEEIDTKTETVKIEDEALIEAPVTSQPEMEKLESDTKSVPNEIKIDVSQDPLQVETNEMGEYDTNPSGPVEIPGLSPLNKPSLEPKSTPSTTQSPPQLLSAHERQSLIGHLVSISDQKSLVLTEKQKIALQQELSFQNQGYRAFSSASDITGKKGFSEQPRRIQNFNQQQGQQQHLSFQQQQEFDSQQQQQFNFQQQQQFDYQQPPQFVNQQKQQFGSQQQPPFGLQQPQQQLFSPRQADQFPPQLQQQFQRTNEQFRGQLQQQRPNSIQSLNRINNIQPQRVFQPEQLSQLQPQSNQIPGQQFQTNPQEIIRTPQQQEAALKKSLLSALKNSFIK